ncbi:helix-turn-helix domain-containing protein [Nocardia gipuzkoensis]
MTTDSVGKVVGENLRRARIGMGESQGEAAIRLQEAGMKWRRDHIASLENGRRPVVSIEELVILTWAYGKPLSYWFEGEGDIAIGSSMTTPRAGMRTLVEGGRRRSMISRTVDFTNVEDFSADDRIAQRLGVDQAEVTAIAVRLWGHSATKERDKRLAAEMPDADPSALRTLRSATTKRLIKEIEEETKD